jgi:DUF3108-like
MRNYVPDLRRSAGAVAIAAAACGLVLAGCGGGGGSGSSGSGGSGSSGNSGNGSSTASTGGSGGSGGSATTASATSAPFPVGVGYTWKYKDVTATGGSDGRTVNKITAVKQVAAGQRITMTAAITTMGSTNHTSSYYVIQPDGEISVPFSQFSSADSGAQVKLLSGGIFWPSQAALESGQTTHSTLKIRYTISGKTQNVTAHIAVKGDGTQSVTVPAGTYSATIVDMTMTEKILGYKIGVEVKTWLASGVGPVKSEVIIDGVTGAKSIGAEDVLVSFHK